MNEFLAQFVLESRELVEHATSGLLTLEQSPRDAACLDNTFRALHTLKGGAGIVEFAAMERAVHAAEEVLSQARAGHLVLGSEAIDSCLTCVDQVATWLNDIEKSDDLPAGEEVKAAADAIVAHIHSVVDGPSVVASDTVQPHAHWVDDHLTHNKDASARAITAVRFVPASDCFLRGEDPLAVLASLPGLLSLDAEPAGQWPTLDALDPFQSMLIFTALSAASEHEVRAHLSGHAGECEIRNLRESARTATANVLPQTAQQVLDHQIALLQEIPPHKFVGIVASAGTVATHTLRYCKHSAAADRIHHATEESLRDQSADYLIDAIRSALAPPQPVATAVAEPTRVDTSTRTIRVNADRIDELVRITGELTVIKNAIGHALRQSQSNHAVDHAAFSTTLKGHHDAFEHLTSELQSAVIAMRVLPLRTVMQRFPRVVRELSAALDKPVRLVTEGEDTEADKVIVEALFEPLLHVVRNALDHGIEPQAIRAKQNKPPVATLSLRASRQSNHVRVEISDDGGGMDVDKIKEVALARGVRNADSLQSMQDSEIIDLVFAPGFSTASAVTELSGRGVGMDAVRTTLERIGGHISIESRKGQGTNVIFTLPFSVLLTDVMIVESGDQVFGIPLDAVVETVRVPIETITRVGATQAIVLRNRTVPVFTLASELGVQQSVQTDEALLVITRIGGSVTGLHVDRLGDRVQVILKPLDGLLTGMPGITGTTILGDGRVLLVLDLNEVVQ